MPFKTVCIKDEIEKQRENDPAFRKAWDDSRAEYELIGQMIRLRKLAEITGNTQQFVSRIERKETIPTIRMFSKLLNALGYELRIVKKGTV